MLMPKRLSAVAALVLAASFLSVVEVKAQNSSDQPTGTTATRPAKEPKSQTSVPSQAAPATTTHKTGMTNQSPTVKKMNKDAKARINEEGK